MTAQSKMNAVNHPRLCLHPRCCWLGVQCTWYSICLCLHKACGRHWPRCNDLHTHTQKGRVLLKPTLSTAVILHRRASSCPSVERDGGVCVCVCATACLLVGRDWCRCWRTVLRVTRLAGCTTVGLTLVLQPHSAVLVFSCTTVGLTLVLQPHSAVLVFSCTQPDTAVLVFS